MKNEDAAKRPHNTGPIKVMTVREVAAYLRVAPITVYRMLKRNQIPAFHMGSDWRFNIEAIARWRLRQESGAISRFLRLDQSTDPGRVASGSDAGCSEGVS